MNIDEAIKVLKNLQAHDRRSIIEVDRKAIDTVVKELEKPLPTDEEIVKEANEIGEKESWPIGRQTGFIFGAKWIRNLMRKETTLDKSTNVVISESEYCDCEYPTLGKSVSCCGNCGRYFKKKGI